MKKVCMFFFIAGISAAALSANVEMDLNLYGTPVSTIRTLSTVTTNGVTPSREAKLKGPFGVDTQFAFYFGSPVKFLDLGLGLSSGMDLFLEGLVYENDELLGSLGFGSLDIYLSIGPSVRFNLGDIHSFSINPGIICNFLLANLFNGAPEFGFYGGFNLDLGYRIWIVNKPGFHFGFDMGTDLVFPFGGILSYRDIYDSRSFSDDVAGGTLAKIYLGVCFNFGDKSVNKF